MKFLLIDTREKPKAIHNILAEEFNADRKTEHRDCINCESADDCAKCREFKDEPQTEREGE